MVDQDRSVFSLVIMAVLWFIIASAVLTIFINILNVEFGILTKVGYFSIFKTVTAGYCSAVCLQPIFRAFK